MQGHSLLNKNNLVDYLIFFKLLILYIFLIRKNHEQNQKVQKYNSIYKIFYCYEIDGLYYEVKY